jgi:hypothetical protein
MKKFRFQFTLRTAFIVSFLFAIVCSLIKCEMDAKSNFGSTAALVRKILSAADREIELDIYNQRHEMAYFRRNDGKTTFGWCGNDESDTETYSSGYLAGSCIRWTIKRDILPPSTDFSETPWQSNELSPPAIDLKVECHRPCSIVSRTTAVTIEVHRATHNRLLLDRLRVAFDKAGLKYDGKED